jgi:AcrR family transcriptional regulator
MSAKEGQASARERLLDAADELFYNEGVHTVGIDRVIEHAGVAKASLYTLFGSKDGLIHGYLERRHEARRGRIEEAFASCDTPRERLLAVFDVLADLLSRPNCRGCAFINAGAESLIGSATEQATRDYRAWVVELLTDQAQAAGAADPEALAAQLILLYDGAAVGVRMDGPSTAPAAARQAAELLIDAATKLPRRARGDRQPRSREKPPSG